MPRRILTLLAVLSLSLGAAACGNEKQEEGQYQSENAQQAETEGIYVTVDDVKYQVQLSKQLNPLLAEDRSYLEGVAGASRAIGRDEEWFAVFMLAQNYADEPKQAASDFEIVDTQEKTYVPVVINETNVWAYRPKMIPEGETLPGPNDPARERSPNGALLLFQLKRDSLNNRPLELNIRGQEDRAIIPLDV